MIDIQANSVTSNYDNSGEYALIMRIPIGTFQQQVFINTFNCMFRVYWIDAYSNYTYRDYSISFSSTSAVQFKNLFPNLRGYNVYVNISNGYCNVYVLGAVENAPVYLQMLHCNEPNQVEYTQNELFNEDFSVLVKQEPTLIGMLERDRSLVSIIDNSLKNTNALSATDKYLKIFEVTTTSSDQFFNDFTFLVSGRHSTSTKTIHDIVHVSLRKNVSEIYNNVAVVNGTSKNSIKPYYHLVHDSGNDMCYIFMEHEETDVLVEITLIQYEQAGNSRISLVNNEVAVSSIASYTLLDKGVPSVEKGVTGDRPTVGSKDYGRMYLDTTLDADGKPIWWNGTDWVDATGATV